MLFLLLTFYHRAQTAKVIIIGNNQPVSVVAAVHNRHSDASIDYQHR